MDEARAGFGPRSVAEGESRVICDKRVQSLGRNGHTNAAFWMDAFASEDRQLRRRARQRVAEMGRAATPVLIEALDSSNDRVRREAVQTLVEAREPATAPALMKALDDSNGKVRRLTAQGIDGLGRESLAPLASGVAIAGRG